MGDASKTPLVEIINSEEFQNIRRLHARGEIGDHPICRNCDIPSLSWPWVVGAAGIGDLTRRKMINWMERYLLRQRIAKGAGKEPIP